MAKQHPRGCERGGWGRRRPHRPWPPPRRRRGGRTGAATKRSHRNECQQVTDVKVSNLHPLYLTGQATNVNASTTNVNARITNVISILKREHSDGWRGLRGQRAKPAEAAGAADEGTKERSSEACRSSRSSVGQCGEGLPEPLWPECVGRGGGEAAQRKRTRRSAQAAEVAERKGPSAPSSHPHLQT